MARLRKNFVSGTTTNNPLAIGGTTLNSAELASLQAVVAPDIAVIVLDPEGDTGAPEIVHVTAHTALATSATILRAQESTVARAFNAGTLWEHSPTALDYDYNNLSNLPTLGRLKSIQSLAAGTTTYTRPAGITAIFVECIGPGGGGAGAPASNASEIATGGGGGGGGYAAKLILNPGASYACVVGTGGAGGIGANPGASGSASTTFDSPSVCTATAGGGGATGTTGTSVVIVSGGARATGTVGDILLDGGPGGAATRLSGTVGSSGVGGHAPRGGMGRGAILSSQSNGSAGGNYGGGGSGAMSFNAGGAATGGAGADGRILVYEYGT